MLSKKVSATLIACVSLVTALPHSGTNFEKRYTEHEILQALAGTYSLVNTTRYKNSITIAAFPTLTVHTVP
jgi:hypothetical protein